MRISFIAVSLILLGTVCAAPFAAAQNSPAGRIAYPPSPKGTQVDDFHGTAVADPYRWLEDTNSPQTRAWIAAQNGVTSSYLATIPERAAIRARLSAIWNYERFSSAFKAGDRYFYFTNPGLLNQSILYVQDGRTGRSRALLDPNGLSSSGTVSLSSYAASPNGRLLAYGISTSGSDWEEFRVRDVDTGRDLGDVLRWVKFSGIGWTRDNKGFYYSRYDAPAEGTTYTGVNRFHKVYYHKVGTPQSRDELIYDRPDQPDWLFEADVTDDGAYAVITVFQGTDERTRLYFIDLDNPGKPRINAPVVRLIDRFDATYQFVGNDGGIFYVRTDLQAARGKIVGVDIDAPRPDRWITLVTESKDALVKATLAGGLIAAEYLEDAHSSIRFFDIPGRRLPGQAQSQRRQREQEREPRFEQPRRGQSRGVAPVFELPLPGIGTVTSLTGHRDDEEILYTFSSFLSPATVYRLNVPKRRNEVFKQSRLPVDLSRYETKQVFYTSKDSTRIPMFVTARRDLKLDGQNPTILFGYGGFNVSKTPEFSIPTIAWLEMGGVYALPNIRGGGEYGKDWHLAGTLERKQNVFDDFIAAAEYLIRQRYTSTPRLAISGRSNGGLLVGASLAQRPDLFAAAVPVVGVMDMLRFHKFTIGWAWTSDYGSADDPKQFPFLRAYSPVHNLKAGTRYPATLVLTADHDDRVVPGHSFKFAAALQAAQAGPAPVLIRVDTEAGHGAGKPTTKAIDEYTDMYAFLLRSLGLRLSAQ